MDTKKNKYDHLLLALANAVISFYKVLDEVSRDNPRGTPQEEAPSASEDNLDEFPMCKKHGVQMKKSKFENAKRPYYCQVCLEEYKKKNGTWRK